MPDAPVQIKIPHCCDLRELLLCQGDLALQHPRYEWVHIPGLPPHCRGVPAGERLTGRRCDRMAFGVIESVADAATA